MQVAQALSHESEGMTHPCTLALVLFMSLTVHASEKNRNTLCPSVLSKRGVSSKTTSAREIARFMP